MQLLKELVTTVADEKNHSERSKAMIRTLQDRLQADNTSTRALIKTLAGSVQGKSREQADRYAKLKQSLENVSSEADQALESSKLQEKGQLSGLMAQDEKDFEVTLQSIADSRNQTAQWYGASEVKVQQAQAKLASAVRHLRAALGAMVNGVTSDTDLDQKDVQMLLVESGESLEALKKAMRDSVRSAKSTAHGLHERTLDKLAPIRQSLVALGTKDDQVSTEIEANRIFVEDKLTEVDEAADRVVNATGSRFLSDQEHIEALLNATQSTLHRLGAGSVPLYAPCPHLGHYVCQSPLYSETRGPFSSTRSAGDRPWGPLFTSQGGGHGSGPWPFDVTLACDNRHVTSP